MSLKVSQASGKYGQINDRTSKLRVKIKEQTSYHERHGNEKNWETSQRMKKALLQNKEGKIYKTNKQTQVNGFGNNINDVLD